MPKNIYGHYGFSEWSNIREFRTPDESNKTPTVELTKAEATGEKTATLEWEFKDEDRGDRQAKYTIQISTKDNFREPIFEAEITNSNRRQQGIRNLTPGTKYYARIKVSDSHDPNRYSKWSNVREFTTQKRAINSNRPPTVTYDGTNNLTLNSARANWTYSDIDDEDAQTQAIVQLFKNETFTGSPTQFDLQGDATQLTMEGLSQNIKYYPRVKAYNVNGESEWAAGEPFSLNSTPDSGEVTIDCSLSRRTVSSTSPTVQILDIEIKGTLNYEWRIRRDARLLDSSKAYSSNSIVREQTLNYAGIRFGQYTPTIEILSNGNITSKTCGTLTNLGNNTVKEIAP